MIKLILFIVVFAWLVSAGKKENTDQPKAETKVAQAEKKEVDFSRPIYTAKYATVCKTSYAFAMLINGKLHEFYSKHSSIFNREEKLKSIGCDEYSGGIPLKNVKKKDPPFEHFYQFSFLGSFPDEYMAMKFNLTNSPDGER